MLFVVLYKFVDDYNNPNIYLYLNHLKARAQDSMMDSVTT